MNAYSTKNDILLADDDPDDVEIFETALQDLNVKYVLRHAPDGTILFKLLDERIPDVLFLDHHMPCKDGIECLLQIRKERAYDQMPIIMYSSQTLPFAVEKAHVSGANRFMAKTTTFNDLVEKMHLIFQRPWSDYLSTPSMEKFMV